MSSYRWRRSSLVAAGLTSAAAGLVLVGLGADVVWLALSAGLLLLATGLVLGSEAARIVTIAVGVVALIPGAYGLFGTAVVAGDWRPCHSQVTASLNSLPAGYCASTDWVGQFGSGGTLISLGVLGFGSAVLLLRAPAKARPDRSGQMGTQASSSSNDIARP